MVGGAVIGGFEGGDGMTVAAVMVCVFNGGPCNVGDLEYRLGHLDASHDFSRFGSFDWAKLRF